MRLEILGQPLIERYAWAVPDERALSICAAFGPLVEMGSGRGYWAHLLQQRGVDILAYDKYVYKGAKGAKGVSVLRAPVSGGVSVRWWQRVQA